MYSGIKHHQPDLLISCIRRMVKHIPGHKTAREYKVLKMYKVVTEAMIETIRLQMKLNKTKYQNLERVALPL